MVLLRREKKGFGRTPVSSTIAQPYFEFPLKGENLNSSTGWQLVSGLTSVKGLEKKKKKKLWQDGRPSVVSWKQNISSNSVCLRENLWRTLCDLVQQVSVLASNAMSSIFCIIFCPLYNNPYFSPVIICSPTIGIPLPPFHILLFSRCDTFWLSSI